MMVLDELRQMPDITIDNTKLETGLANSVSVFTTLERGTVIYKDVHLCFWIDTQPFQFCANFPEVQVPGKRRVWDSNSNPVKYHLYPKGVRTRVHGKSVQEFHEELGRAYKRYQALIKRKYVKPLHDLEVA